MWTTIKSLLFSKIVVTEPNLPHDFDQVVQKAITLIKNNDNLNSDEQFLKCLVDNGIDYTSAREILLFLPIAFIRHWIPMARWSDSYIEILDEKNRAKRNTTKQYLIR
jgi:hypothetical protein